jgi:hypothetical protein
MTVVSITADTTFGVHPDRVSAPQSPLTALRRRLGGRYPLDPFGLDAQLSDLVAPILRSTVRVTVTGEHHLPAQGAAVLAMNRGFGIFEPTALTIAVMNATSRRARVVGAPGVWGVGAALRRFGAIAATAADLGAALDAGHLVVVPLAPTWLSATAGAPPLELLQVCMRVPVIPVAVRPAGPLGTAISGWKLTIGAPIVGDDSIAPGDPLGAAELSETIRNAVDNLL